MSPKARTARGRVGRPAKVTVDQIVDAAIAIIEEKGADQLSLRGVAQRLDVTPMALYNHVSNRDEMEKLIADRLRAKYGAAWDRAEYSGWRSALNRSATFYEEIAEAYPHLAQLRSVLVRSGWNFTGVELLLSGLAERGLDQAAAIRVAHLAHLIYRGAIADAKNSTVRLAGDVAGLELHYDDLDKTEFPLFAEASLASRGMDLSLSAAINFLGDLVELLIDQQSGAPPPSQPTQR